MKTLIVYSSLTGNTKKVAEAIAEAISGCALHSVKDAPAPDGFDLVAVGYWVDKGKPDAAATAYMEGIQGKKVAVFGTLGAWPDSDHARDCQRNAEKLLTKAGQGNTVLGSYICQGRVDPRLTAAMQKMAKDVHPMTPERIARLKEAEKHPDEEDCRKAQALFVSIMEKAAKA